MGSTGSGKSNSVVSIIKSILSTTSNSRVVLIDPHGEYASAFPTAKVFRINDSANPLYIPFWLMNFDELAFFLVGAKPNDDQRREYRLLRQKITEKKKENSKLKAGEVNINYITADSPIPFNARNLWYEINWWLNASFSETAINNQIKEVAEVINEGDASNLIGAQFKPYNISNKAPYKSKHQEMYSYEKKLITRLKDSRYDFLFNPGEYKDESSQLDLHNLLQDWIGNKQRLTILDLSNVPFEVLDISVGLITRFLYDSMFWGKESTYTGRNRPLLIAYEEAHSYLGKDDSTRYAKNAVERIFKEGRKFGVGAMVISQRPSELSDSILAQVGTFLTLRLTNSSDQSIVKSLAPDNMNSLMSLLPSLRVGEAVCVGEAISIPTRLKLELQVPRPDSSDPKLVESWSKPFTKSDTNYMEVVTSLREQKYKED